MSLSNGGGQVSPVRTMAVRMILLSFSSHVQVRSKWLIVCSSFSLEEHVRFWMTLNLWRYDLVKPWPVTIAVNSAEMGSLVFILSFMCGKNNLLTAPLLELVHCLCHFVSSSSFPSVIIVSLGILLYTISSVSSVAASLARQSAISFPCVPACAFTQLKITVHCRSSSRFNSFLLFSISTRVVQIKTELFK